MCKWLKQWLYSGASGSSSQDNESCEYMVPLLVVAALGLATQFVAAGGQAQWSLAAWNLIGFYVLLTLASVLAGGALGFLFGLPKEAVLSGQSTAGATGGQTSGAGLATAQSTELGHNTNLEQVSDWLTKILLGAGLSQLSEAPNFMLRTAQRLSTISGDSSQAVIICVIIAYVVIGFAIAFLWAKLRLPLFMEGRNNELKAALAKAQEIKKDRDQVLDGLEKKLFERESPSTGDPIDGIVAQIRQLSSEETPIADWRVKDVARGDARDDPWKGQFGDRAQCGGYSLSAKVDPIPGNDEFFEITLTVSADVGKPPLPDGEYVRIFLHDSYPENKPVVAINNGIAQIKLIGWGAFTVGVLANKGETMLELDLANLESAPRVFRER